MPNPGRAKYRRVIDLYTTGTELVLRDGSVLWLAVLNPFERDEALHDAQVARSRLSLAMRNEESDDYARVRSVYQEIGREAVVEALLDNRRADLYIRTIDEIRTEEDWREKVEVLERNNGLASAPTMLEQETVDRIGLEYATELNARVESVLAGDGDEFRQMSEDDLWDEYFDWWLDRRGSEVALAEYRIGEIWLGARICYAEHHGDEAYDHSACDGHGERAFASKDEVRHLPEQLQSEIIERFVALEMSERDARFSARQGSSSESSPLPSKPEDSQPSIPTVTPSAAHGPSTSP